MMILVKDIKEYCAERKAILKNAIEKEFAENEKPKLAVIQIGNHEASNR